jgi:hypothetical protein
LVRTQRAHLGCARRPRVPSRDVTTGIPLGGTELTDHSPDRQPAREPIRSTPSAQANPLKPILTTRSVQSDRLAPDPRRLTSSSQIPSSSGRITIAPVYRTCCASSRSAVTTALGKLLSAGRSIALVPHRSRR